MFLLDTNHHKLFVAGDEAVVARILRHERQVYLSSVAAEEFLVPFLNALNRAKSPRTSLSLSQAHTDFVEAISDLTVLPLFPYDDSADAVYKTFSPTVIRVGSQDCRIAAQAMAHGLTVVTRNLRDFERIGAPCADWSV